MERTPKYLNLKRNIIEKLLKLGEKLIRDLRDHIIVQELATPLTYKKYSLSNEGAWHNPSQLNKKLPNFIISIDNFLLAGGNTIGEGVPRVFEFGFKTARYILNK